MNSHQAGTVNSRVDHNEQGIKPETCQGYQEKVFQKTIEDSNGFETHEAPWQMLTTESLNRSSISVLHHVQSSFGGVISIVVPYATSCLAPVLEGGPG